MSVCPTCGRSLPADPSYELEQAVRAVQAVDRAVRARKRAATRDVSPYRFPAAVAARLGRAA